MGSRKRKRRNPVAIKDYIALKKNQKKVQRHLQLAQEKIDMIYAKPKRKYLPLDFSLIFKIGKFRLIKY